MKDDFVCALSGITPTEEETDAATQGIPEGWIEITIKRIFPNQRYMILQQLKERATEIMLSQIPEDQRDQALDSVRVQVDAQYYAYESSLKEYEEESDTIYIAPPESDESILKEYQKLANDLGFDSLLYDEEDGSSEPEDLDEEEEAADDGADSDGDTEK